MLDIETEEALIRKIGGKFALTKLSQLRMIELNRGAAPMVHMEDPQASAREIVCREILEGKLVLAEREDRDLTNAAEKERIESASEVAATAPKEGESEVYGRDIKKIKEQRIKELAELLNPKK